MKAGISVMLGLLLAFVLVFAYWLRTPHRLGARGTRWTLGWTSWRILLPAEPIARAHAITAPFLGTPSCSVLCSIGKQALPD